MRLFLPAIFCLVANTAAAEGPFTPPGVKPPDYVVTMAINGSMWKPGSEMVVHHGDWTRMARIVDSPITSYYHDRDRITVFGNSLVVIRGPQTDSLVEYAPRNTGERQTHLGESCTVWEVARSKSSSMPADLSNVSSSCVTDDGIELSHTLLNSHGVLLSAEATQIERRSVLPGEVRPPESAFSLDWPDRDTLPPIPPIPPEKPDHEVVMEEAISPGKVGSAIRIVRRHGPWLFTDETAGKMRTIGVVSDYGRKWFAYESDESGAPKRLIINTVTPTPAEQANVRALLPQPKREDGTETVLGETCYWFDMTPGMRDRGTSSCLTKDGIPLKERRFSRNSQREWTAIRVARRPIAIEEIKLASELLSPQLWGVE